jgi:hypothetical protein
MTNCYHLFKTGFGMKQLDNTLKEFAITLLIEQRMELWKV